jgi:hypothetical protein
LKCPSIRLSRKVPGISPAAARLVSKVFNTARSITGREGPAPRRARPAGDVSRPCEPLRRRVTYPYRGRVEPSITDPMLASPVASLPGRLAQRPDRLHRARRAADRTTALP